MYDLDELELNALAIVARRGLSSQRRVVVGGTLCDLLIRGHDNSSHSVTLAISLRNWAEGDRSNLASYATREANLLLTSQGVSLVKFLVPGSGAAPDPMITIEGLEEYLAGLNLSAPYRSALSEPLASQTQGVAFCAMPFHEDFLDVYEFAIVPAIVQVGFVTNRLDQTHSFTGISKRIWDGINDARFVIADISGCNPNVMYEIGLAHGVGTKTFLIRDATTQIPFDIKDNLVVEYDRKQLHRLTKELPPKLKQALQEL